MNTQGFELRDYTALKGEINKAIEAESKEIVLDGYILKDIDNLSELNLGRFEKVEFRNCSFNFEEREFFVSSISISNLEFYNCTFEGAKIQFLDLENVTFKNCAFDVDDTVSFEDIGVLYAESTSINCRNLEIINTYLDSIDLTLDNVYKFLLRCPEDGVNISFESDIDSSDGINGDILTTTSTIRFEFDETAIDYGLFSLDFSHNSPRFREIHIKGKSTPLGKSIVKNTDFGIQGNSVYPVFLILSYLIFGETFRMKLSNSNRVYISFIECRFGNPKEIELINIDLSKTIFIGKNEALEEFYIKNPTMSAGFILGENIVEYRAPPQLVSILQKEYGVSIAYKDVLEEYGHLIKNESLKNRREHEMVYTLKRRKEFIEAKYENTYLMKLLYYLRYWRYSTPSLVLAFLALTASSLVLGIQWIGHFWSGFNLELLSRLPSSVFSYLKTVGMISLLLLFGWVKEKRGIKIPTPFDF